MAVAVLVFVSAYAAVGAGADDDHKVMGAHLLDFDAGYVLPDNTSDIAWLGGAPIDPSSPHQALESEGRPGITYVAATGETGCRLPTHARLRRHGDRLYVRFTGGDDSENCYRPYTPFAQFAVPTVMIDGATAVR